jgi:hypothetical protein
LNKESALECARKWVNQSKLSELEPDKVWEVLEALSFISKGRNSSHTTYRWFHKSLLHNEVYFKYGFLSLSVGHGKGKQTVIRIDSIKKLQTALELYLEGTHEKED